MGESQFRGTNGASQLRRKRPDLAIVWLYGRCDCDWRYFACVYPKFPLDSA